jgi:hypothetical protein
MGGEALKQWGDDVARVEPLTGGVANQVCSVRMKGGSRSVVSALGATLTSRGRPNCCDTFTAKG